MSRPKATAIRGNPVTLQRAADAFLSSPRCENPNTRRAYASVIDKLTAQLDPAGQLADVDDSEIANALETLWGDAAAATWNRNRAAVGSWLSWCDTTKRWPAPTLPPDCERHAEHADHTSDLPKRAIDRQLSRRDIPLREKTLWRMLYETAARASEILALDVEQLDLANRRSPCAPKAARPNGCTGVPAPRTSSHASSASPTAPAAPPAPCSSPSANPCPRDSHRPGTYARTPADPGSATTAPAPASCYIATPAGGYTSCDTPPLPTSARRKSRCS
jgi:hypothetical protein